MQIRLRILVLFTCASAWATPTTHIWGPSADVQAYGVWHVTADYYLLTEQTRGGGRIQPVTNTGLTVGVLPFEKVNAEVGIDHKSGLGGADDCPLYFNAKIAVPENAVATGFPAIAVGAYDVGTESDMTGHNILYAKAARVPGSTDKNIGRLSLGVIIGNDKLLLDDKGEADESGFMVAWERTMTDISPKLWACLEYMAERADTAP